MLTAEYEYVWVYDIADCPSFTYRVECNFDKISLVDYEIVF